MVAIPAPNEVLDSVRRDVERSLRRGRNGLRYAAGTRRPKVGQTPRDLVWQRDKAQLWRYRGDAVRHRPPVLIVHSLVSRSYVLDLSPGNSAIAFLLDAGLDVLLLEWGVADEADACNGLETYCDDYLPDAVRAALEVAGDDEITLYGYCFGGVLALIALARHPDLPVRNLVVMATPVDFAGMGALTSLVREGRVDPDHIVDETGNVPPDAIENAFRMLKPTAEAAQYANLWQNLWNDEWVEGYQAMGQWARDHVPFPGEAFRQTVDQLIRSNGLVNGTLQLGGRTVDLGAISCPVLNVMAEHDHIVPLSAAEPVVALVGSQQTDELRLPAGHVGLVAGRSANKRTLPQIVAWITDHSEPMPAEED